MRFRLLGAVEATVDGEVVDLGHARQRSVLAVLLVGAGSPVSPDQLLERVWTGQLPQHGREVLYGYLSRLRRVLAPGGVAIVRRCGGYLLDVDDAAVDVRRFRRLTAQARATTDDERALALLAEALELWRGEAFAGLDAPWLATVRAELDRERFAAQLDHADVALRRGRHGELLADLSTRAAEHPLDERLAGQLMLAQYRSGRQAEALEHYRRTRRRLVEELGADPGQPLRQLQKGILAADPLLVRPSPAAAPPLAVPRQLPAPPRWFIGRGRELGRLDETIGRASAVVISAIGGMGGIGKTCLALHWAYERLAWFPDGQLYVNLRGFDGSADPTDPGVAVRGFLDALGVASAAIPADLDAQVGLYRSLVADRRMLILLDDAADTAQVAPLLPGGAACTVLVTSRRRLGGLVATHGAQPLTLDVLDDADARRLLTSRIGHGKVTAEPAATTDLLGHCAGLPLALGVVAARAATRPEFRLAALAEELAEASARLDALDSGELTANLRAAFWTSYRALDPAAATVFCLLGLVPGPEIGAAAVAGLAGLPAARAAAALRELEGSHLVQQCRPGRYRMHDLVRLYASEQARAQVTEQERADALRRLTGFYIHTAYAGERLLDPHRSAIGLAPLPPGCLPCRLPDVAGALDWFTAEHPCLLAALASLVAEGDHRGAWQLAWSLGTFHWRRGHVPANVDTWRAALAAARGLADPLCQAQAHRRLGLGLARAGDHSAALDHLRQSVELAGRVGDVVGQAHAHHSFAWAWARRGDDELALSHAEQALKLLGTAGNPVWEAEALNLVGWYSARAGLSSRAAGYCRSALALCGRLDDREGQADALDSLGYIEHSLGRHVEAVGYYERALTLFDALGHTYEQANTLDSLGRALAALGRCDEARRAWAQALCLYEVQQRTVEAGRVQEQLAVLGSPVTPAVLAEDRVL